MNTIDRLKTEAEKLQLAVNGKMPVRLSLDYQIDPGFAPTITYWSRIGNPLQKGEKFHNGATPEESTAKVLAELAGESDVRSVELKELELRAAEHGMRLVPNVKG